MKRLAGGFGLLEAARWYPGTGLVFSDMTRGGVFTLASPSAAPAVLIPHRKGIGGLVRHAAGGFVVAGRNVAHKASDSPTRVVLETGDDEQFFNDLTADGHGRVFVGSVGVAGPGRLYCLGLDGTTTVMADDVLISNGLGTDPAGERLYHVDSGRRTIWCYALGAARLGEGRSAFVDTSEYGGVPDGLAVAADGSVWVAMAGGSVVVAWDAGGRRIAETPLPHELVTSVCFGGRDYRTLYVLTGHDDDHPDADGGCVYAGAAGWAGLPGAVAHVPFPQMGMP